MWGTAPVLVRTTTTPGEIKVRASVVWQGKHTPVSAELIIPTRKAAHPLIANPEEVREAEAKDVRNSASTSVGTSDCEKRIHQLQQELNRLKLKEVEKQQSDFE